MAVETTPERSLSVLLRSSRALWATAGCTRGLSSVPKWLVVSITHMVRRMERAGSERKAATRASVFSSSA